MHLRQADQPCKPPEPNQLWADFLEARGRALDTLRIEDAARAGEAWAAFLYSFTEAASPLAPGGAE
jgi:hypothetical protein